MLGKLMKYEWKATWKLLVPLDAFILLMAMLSYGTIQLSFFDSDSNVVVMTGILMIITYLLSMFVIVAGTVIYLVYRFYKSVYGDEGYLLHTLPVDKHHIIIAKAAVSASWLILNTVTIYCSILLLFSANSEVIENFTGGFDYYVNIMSGNYLYDRAGAFNVIMSFAASLFAIFARILKVFACISLGQLSSNHKVLSSIGFYYGIYFVQRMLTVIYYVVAELFEKVSDSSYPGYFGAGYGSAWAFNLIASLVYCVVFYFLTWYVMEKKLNLD